MEKNLYPARSRGHVRLARHGLGMAWLPALLVASAPAAGQVLIDPVVVEVAANQRVATVAVTLTDKATAPLRLQAQVLRWQQDLQGEDVTAPSDDLLVTPVIAEVAPGQKQLFRVALRGPRPAAGELSYRLILEDVGQPQPASNAPGMSINFRMRYDLPVLLAPTGAVVERMRWLSCAAAQAKGPEACMRLRNEGNRRIKIQALTIAGAGWQQEVRLKQPIFVLSGAERELHLPLQGGHSLPLRAVRLQTAPGKSLDAEAGNE